MRVSKLDASDLTAGFVCLLSPEGLSVEDLTLDGPPRWRDEGVAWQVGRPYVLELPLKADFAFVKAYRGDTLGNLVYRRTSRNFSPMMAAAAAVTIAEVERLVEPGVLGPDEIITPGIFVRYIFEGRGYQKRIERRPRRLPLLSR